MKFEFETTEKGEFTGFYGQPENNINKIPITETNVNDGKIVLKIKVFSAEFKGEIKGDRFVGQWSQAGLSSMPLEMKKGEYIPFFPLDIPEETREQLSGEWHGQRKIPREGKMMNGSYNMSFRFETNERGEFLGFYDVPDLYRWNIPVTEASLKDGNLILKMQKGNNIEFKGQLTDEELAGEMAEQGANAPVSLKKGKYTPIVYSLDLSGDDRAFLSGEWVGEIKEGDKVIQKIFFAFKSVEKGKFFGFQKFPVYGDIGFPIIGASFSDGKLSIIGVDADFNVQEKGDEFTGEVIIVTGKKYLFSLKKEKYAPPVFSLKLPEETMKTLSGKWKGNLGSYNMVFRFEKNKDGDFLGFIDNTDTNQTGIPILNASMSEGKLTLRNVNAVIKGKLSKDSLECEWTQGAQITPLALKKE
jgi:hypothetical protein